MVDDEPLDEGDDEPVDGVDDEFVGVVPLVVLDAGVVLTGVVVTAGVVVTDGLDGGVVCVDGGVVTTCLVWCATVVWCFVCVTVFVRWCVVVWVTGVARCARLGIAAAGGTAVRCTDALPSAEDAGASGAGGCVAEPRVTLPIANAAPNAAAAPTAASAATPLRDVGARKAGCDAMDRVATMEFPPGRR